jgi:Flp pilus assembly protein protease CpaA
MLTFPMRNAERRWLRAVMVRQISLLIYAGGAAVTDWRGHKIYNVWTFSFMAVGFVLRFLQGGPGALLPAAGAAAGLILFLFPFYKAGGLGAGDLKYLAGISLHMELRAFLYFLFFTFLFALAGAAAGSGGRLRGSHRTGIGLPALVSVLFYLGGLYP